MQKSIRRWLAMGLVFCLLLGGCKKEVPEEPTEDESVTSEQAKIPFEGIETKDVTFERIGRFTLPADYVLTEEGSTHKARDSIYYSMFFNTKLQAQAVDLAKFEQFVISTAKVSMREYDKLFSEELTLDGCTAFYVEGRGKDSSKYKYTVFLGVNTPNGLTIVSAVINDEDWPDKCDVVKDILHSFKCEGMVDMEELKENLVLPELKPSIVIPSGWKLVNDADGIKQFKNASGSVEFTMFFGKQDDLSLDRLTKNNPVNWNIQDTELQGYPGRTAKGQGSTSETSSKTFEITEVTYQNKRCIIASVVDETIITDEEQNELYGVMSTVSYKERDKEDVPLLQAGDTKETEETEGVEEAEGQEQDSNSQEQASNSQEQASNSQEQSSNKGQTTTEEQASSSQEQSSNSQGQTSNSQEQTSSSQEQSSSTASSEISIGGLISFD